ncbi:class I SAM-dependent RNA methyltransferase [soil metagenome]
MHGVAETLTIASLGHSGDGIAETAGGRVFVPYTLPGETVEIERSGERAQLLAVLATSPYWGTPACRHFGVCGNCALEHMAKPAYLAWKRTQVVAAFQQRGIDAPVEPMVPVAPGGRRRAIFSAERTAGGVVLGFHRRASPEIVAIDECAVLSPTIVGKLPLLREIAALVVQAKKPARVTVLSADNGLDVAVTGAGKLDQPLLQRLGGLAADQALARLTIDGTEVFQNRRPEIVAGGATLFPVPGGFVQASASAEKAMAEAVLAHVGADGPVADLFCGIGTFSLRLARRATVTAVESDKALLTALDQAVRRATGTKPVTGLRRDLFANPLAPGELNRFAAVVFDPPAPGAKALAATIAQSKVPKVVAVSCNPATLARDARIILDGGYRLTRVLPVDQFLWSAEIEAVACFER